MRRARSSPAAGSWSTSLRCSRTTETPAPPGCDAQQQAASDFRTRRSSPSAAPSTSPSAIARDHRARLGSRTDTATARRVRCASTESTARLCACTSWSRVPLSRISAGSPDRVRARPAWAQRCPARRQHHAALGWARSRTASPARSPAGTRRACAAGAGVRERLQPALDGARRPPWALQRQAPVVSCAEMLTSTSGRRRSSAVTPRRSSATRRSQGEGELMVLT
jgi:hypothetical protein